MAFNPQPQWRNHWILEWAELFTGDSLRIVSRGFKVLPIFSGYWEILLGFYYVLAVTSIGGFGCSIPLLLFLLPLLLLPHDLFSNFNEMLRIPPGFWQVLVGFFSFQLLRFFLVEVKRVWWFISLSLPKIIYSLFPSLFLSFSLPLSPFSFSLWILLAHIRLFYKILGILFDLFRWSEWSPALLQNSRASAYVIRDSFGAVWLKNHFQENNDHDDFRKIENHDCPSKCKKGCEWFSEILHSSRILCPAWLVDCKEESLQNLARIPSESKVSFFGRIFLLA